MENKYQIGIIGLGYVGLPLAHAFANKFKTIGFDIDQSRVDEINNGKDRTQELDTGQLKDVLDKNLLNSKSKVGLFCTTQVDELKSCNVYIVTVPTPTDKNNRPILTPLHKASETVGTVLHSGNIVIYESTVYPGVTEDECVPILEKVSGLEFNEDFYVGYSPERINPGDKEHTVTKIKKVTSGSTKESAIIIDELYKTIITAGTHLAESIKVAEAAKVIENAQRDINIAFINELSKIFRMMDIDTNSVLEASATKWNFLKFQPGLVGGHCIGVDPYYLAQKAQEVGYNPEIILAGRRLNDSMGTYTASETIKLMIKNQINVSNAEILILGFTFKENCPDFRNTKVIDIYNELKTYNIDVLVCDPWIVKEDVQNEYEIDFSSKIPQDRKFDAIILAVPHKEFKSLNIDSLLKNQGIIFDVKGLLPKDKIHGRL